MNLTALLMQQASSLADKTAIVDVKAGQDRSVTFAELSHKVQTGAGQLEAAGLRKGATILVYQPVTIELYELLLAAFYSGMRVMLVDPSADASFLQKCCARVTPDAFFGSWKAQLLRLRHPDLRRIPLAFRTDGWWPGTQLWKPEKHEPAPIARLEESAPALITFTSGSTGEPKAAVRSHGFLLEQQRVLAQSLDFEEGEVDLITLPVFLLANLASGLTSVLADTDLRRPGSPDTARVSSQCERQQVTRCAASPAFFEAMLCSDSGIPNFRKVYTGGAPVFPRLLEKLQERLPHAELVAVYGSTEAEPIAHLSARDYTQEFRNRTAAGDGLCAGHPVEDIDLRILRRGSSKSQMGVLEFENACVKAGTMGEVIVSGAHVLSGYLDGIGNTETKIHVAAQVWHRTGDAGFLDPDGLLWLVGRCSAELPAAPVNPNPRWDYPLAVEAALAQQFPPTRTAVIGVKGQRVLVVEGDPEGIDVATFEASASQFGIEKVITIPQIPMDKRHQAKVNYPELLRLSTFKYNHLRTLGHAQA